MTPNSVLSFGDPELIQLLPGPQNAQGRGKGTTQRKKKFLV